MKARLLVGVAALWTLVGVVSGAQAALTGPMQGASVPFGPSLQGALVNSLPWIPGTLVVVWLATRFPLTRDSWPRAIWIHLAAIPIVTYLVYVLVVLGFWTMAGDFQGPDALFSGALFWATLRIHISAVLYAAIAGVTHVVAYYRETRSRELRLARLESQLARARLRALNAQIRPHFLFNTLHTIGQMWRSGRHDEADGLLDRLGSLFQRVQSTASQAEVSLQEELDLVREYLEIEQVRFRDRLTTKVSASDSSLRCAVPPLLLQPLVENAVRHGISVSASAGSVEVEASVSDHRLRIDVRDDGPGPIEDAPSRGTGTGLSNTRERLAQMYGGEATLEANAGAEGGFLASVVLPARTVNGDGVA